MIGLILGCVGILTLLSGMWFHAEAASELRKATEILTKARRLVDEANETEAKTDEALRRAYRIHQQIKEREQ